MGHEISQFDIPDRQLLAANAQSRIGMGKDIGKAKITHTIFGRAKVRVIREQDRKRRAWLLTALVLVAIAAAVWQGWLASQQTEPFAVPRLSATVRVTAPAFNPEYIPPSPSDQRQPRTQLQTEIESLVASPKSVPQPPPVLKAADAKSLMSPPLVVRKPQTVLPAENNNATKIQSNIQQPPKLAAPIQPVTPILATPPDAQSAESDPMAITPRVEPLIEENSSIPPPAGDNHPPDPVNAQP
ncbi:MAG: hypothetical protein WAW75_09455 [Gallionella sp.]